MHRFSFYLIWCAAYLWGYHQTSYAVEPFEIPPTGELYELTLNSVSDRQEPLILYFVSPGSVSLAAGLIVEGPPGLRVDVDSMRLAGDAPVSDKLLRGDRTYEPSSLLPSEISNRGAAGHFVIDPMGKGGRVHRLYHLHKNACLADKSARYISRITFWLSQVPVEYLGEGSLLRVAVKEFRYPGSEAASVKPVAEGRYRGEPLLLMSSIQYGGEYVNLHRRAGDRIHVRRRLPVVKYVYHRGRTLSVVRLRGLLTGGRATFELSNGGYVYGVCFSLVRRRQMVNGY